MACRDDSRKYNCIDKKNSICVTYDGYLPDYSELIDKCPTIEETTTELYEWQERILEAIDLTDLGEKCINYNPFKEDEDLKVKEAFLAIESEFCKLKDIVSEVKPSISDFDLKCLVEPCGDDIDSDKKLIQILINEICLLKEKVSVLENTN